MGLFWAFLVGIIVCAILTTVCIKIYNDYDDWELVSGVFTFFFVASLIISIIGFGICGISAIRVNNPHCQASEYAQTLATRDNLIYQLENQTYLNDNNVGASELFEDVLEFNKAVVSNQEDLKNPWVCNLTYDYWNNIAQIDLSNYNK